MDAIGEVRELARKYQQIWILAAGIVILVLLRETIQDTASRVIFLYLVIIIAYGVNGKVPLVGGVILSVAAAVVAVAAAENSGIANQLAMYAFYFLAVGAVLLLIEYIRSIEDAAPDEKPAKAEKKSETKSADEKPRCIAIASGKGGVGKTTIAANLGIALAKMNRKTTIVDLDFAMPNLEIITGLKTPPVGLIDVLEGKIDLSKVIYTGPEGVKIIPPGVMLEGYRKNLEKIRAIIKDTHENNDYTILDMPPGRAAIDLFSRDIETILIVNPTKAAVLDALNMKVLLEKEGSRVIGAILNRAEEDVEGWIEEIEKTLDVYVVGVIPESDEVKDASSTDQCFISAIPECGPSKEITWLAEEIIRISLLENYPEDQKKK